MQWISLDNVESLTDYHKEIILNDNQYEKAYKEVEDGMELRFHAKNVIQNYLRVLAIVQSQEIPRPQMIKSARWVLTYPPVQSIPKEELLSLLRVYRALKFEVSDRWKRIIHFDEIRSELFKELMSYGGSMISISKATSSINIWFGCSKKEFMERFEEKFEAKKYQTTKKELLSFLVIEKQNAILIGSED